MPVNPKPVAIVTGGGHGLGRSYAILLAQRGMRVVVNSSTTAEVSGEGPSAERVAQEIRQSGGEAVGYPADVSSWSEAGHLVAAAVDVFGRLDVLVNNAGVLRDRTLANMSEEEWDVVVDVHLKGQAGPLHWASAYWKERHKAGDRSPAAVVNTTAGGGLFGNPGQANYAAAKAGVVGLTLVAARELERYGVRVNAIAPVARTRQTESILGSGPRSPESGDSRERDPYDPDGVAPLVAYLVDRDCPFTGQVFNMQAGEVAIYQGWTVRESFSQAAPWTVEQLRSTLSQLPPGPPPFGHADQVS